MVICGDNTTVHEKQNPSTSRSQLRQQTGVTPRSFPERSRAKKKGSKITSTVVPVPASYRSGDGSTARSAYAVQAGVQTSARSTGTAVSFSSSRNARGLHDGSDCGRGPLSGRTTSRSHASSALSPTDYSTDTPRGSARTTTTTAMSTARAEATLAVLEAERAQLEHRLKKVEDELRQEQSLAMSESRKRGAGRGVPRRAVR